MSRQVMLCPSVERSIIRKEPLLWLNDAWLPLQEVRLASPLNLDHVHEAERRLNRFAGLLTHLFPELKASHGIIESQLHSAYALQRAMMGGRLPVGQWLIKGDHALPVAGSIKARGGIYEILLHAENLALRFGVMRPQDDPLVLASSKGRELFARHNVAVGSTGNLGLSVGVMAAALGFQATVHMSSDAKEWKKARLRARGVEVSEHEGDFGAAVSAGRAQARQCPNTYFVDDENSIHLFLGYSAAAPRLQRQLIAQGVKIDAQHPLFVYLPCGVGGAPGGITFGLRHLFGDHVHCFFAEPLASPSMLIRLAAADDCCLSIRDVGLDNRTEADGLAVAQASTFVAPIMRPLASGVFTVPDDDLFEDLYLLEQSEGMRIEPSAAAGFRGPRWLLDSDAGRQYVGNRGLLDCMHDATHILWTTGGAFVPDEEYRQFHERGHRIAQRKASNKSASMSEAESGRVDRF
jgi:D-serine dehydratase